VSIRKFWTKAEVVPSLRMTPLPSCSTSRSVPSNVPPVTGKLKTGRPSTVSTVAVPRGAPVSNRAGSGAVTVTLVEMPTIGREAAEAAGARPAVPATRASAASAVFIGFMTLLTVR
jgi:hypothetical protein